jgi:hypothetical protein
MDEAGIMQILGAFMAGTGLQAIPPRGRPEYQKGHPRFPEVALASGWGTKLKTTCALAVLKPYFLGRSVAI